MTTRTRRRNFERVYDLTERVIPSDILALPTRSAADAHRDLIEHAARALGVATAAELRDYYRLRPDEGNPAVAALVEMGVLVPVKVPGWPSAFRYRNARSAKRGLQCALLAPFDLVVWEWTRAERLFDFRYRIEIYIPAEKRWHGHYVLPYLLDDRLVARVDLKADRQWQWLVVRAVHLGTHAPKETLAALEIDLENLAYWLGLGRVAGLFAAGISFLSQDAVSSPACRDPLDLGPWQTPFFAGIIDESTQTRLKSILFAPRGRSSSSSCNLSQTPAYCQSRSRRQ